MRSVALLPCAQGHHRPQMCCEDVQNARQSDTPMTVLAAHLPARENVSAMNRGLHHSYNEEFSLTGSS